MNFDQISDMLTRIRNAQKAGKLKVEMPRSNFKLALARSMYENGYLDEVSIFSETSKKFLRLKLKYQGNEPAIKGIRRVSRQGQRIYASKDEIPYIKDGFGIVVVSTPKGLMNDVQARKEGLGGELICEIW